MSERSFVQLSMFDEPAAPVLPQVHQARAAVKSGELWAEITDILELERRVKECQRCGLRAGCKGVVFGEGNSRAKLMLVGEAPGAVEDETGRPFVGPAGQLLEKILAAIGLTRQDVYIANVVKCRPPGNRLPTPQEAATCYPHLKAQLRLVKPSVVVCLGALSTQVLIDPSARITRVRGRWVEKDGVLYMPTYHPAALLRDPNKKKPVWEDFKEVRRVLLQLEQRES